MSVVLTTLREQEEIIERDLAAFIRVGNALMRIREDDLYHQAGFATFRDYLESKPWGIGENAAYKQIQAARIAEICTDVQSEAHARELAPLLRKATPDVVREVYAEVLDETGGKPTAQAIREKVKEVLPSTNGNATRRNKTDEGVVQSLHELKALIPKWDQSALDTLSASECRRRVQLAQVVADWLTTEFLPAHEPRVAPLSKVPT